jgi:putative membrane protein
VLARAPLGRVLAGAPVGRVLARDSVGGVLGRAPLGRVLGRDSVGRMRAPIGRVLVRESVGRVLARAPLGRVLAGAPVGRVLARESVGRVLAGAAALTAWDLFLDPQMTAEGYWGWAQAGRYRGIPARNYAGWFVTALAIMAALERLLPPGEPVPALVGVYAWVAVMSTLGFAVFFRDPLVAVVGGAAMMPPALAALAALRRACPGGR